MRHWLHASVGTSAVLLVLSALAGCSAAVPLGITFRDGIHNEEKIVTGVVNGLWQYDQNRNAARLRGHFIALESDEALELAHRHQIRVGVDRSYWIAHAEEIVILPEGWRYSADQVVDDGKTVNVGDVVQIRRVLGTRLDVLDRIVRKCHEPAGEDENKDWNIGCKKVESFGRNGYGGEMYFWSAF